MKNYYQSYTKIKSGNFFWDTVYINETGLDVKLVVDTEAGVANGSKWCQGTHVEIASE